MLLIVICLSMGKNSLNLKPTIKTLTFQLNFVLEVFLIDLVLLSFRSIFKRNVNDFSFDYNSIDKSDILNIHKHLMTKNNIK